MGHYKNLDTQDIYGEKWFPVKGWENIYLVSSFSRIKSVDRKVKHWRGGESYIKGKIIKQILRKGYLTVNLSNGKSRNIRAVHQMVAEVFVRNIHNFKIPNHEDGDKLNNMPYNLKWGTTSYNIRHAFSMGLIKKRFGEDNSSSKLKNRDIIKIKKLISVGVMKHYEIADMFNVSAATICNINRNKNWNGLQSK